MAFVNMRVTGATITAILDTILLLSAVIPVQPHIIGSAMETDLDFEFEGQAEQDKILEKTHLQSSTFSPDTSSQETRYKPGAKTDTTSPGARPNRVASSPASLPGSTLNLKRRNLEKTSLGANTATTPLKGSLSLTQRRLLDRSDGTTSTSTKDISRSALLLVLAKKKPVGTRQIDAPANRTKPTDTSDRDSETGSTFPLTADLPAQVKQLRSYLEGSQYLGLLPEQEDHVPLPDNQPRDRICPAATGSWWPRQEMNLRSTCPWVWEELDNGPDSYPRFIRQAKCLCQKCIITKCDSDSDVCNGACHVMHHNVNVFRVKGSHGGLAIMEETVVTVPVACFCVAPGPQDKTPTVNQTNT